MAISGRAMAFLLCTLLAGCGMQTIDRSLPVYTIEQIDSTHPGHRRTTLSTAGASYVNDFEEQSLQLIDVDPKRVVGRRQLGDTGIRAIAGQDPAAYLAVDVGSEMPAYEVFRNAKNPPFDWRHVSFQKLRLAMPMGPAANKETTDAAVIDDVLRALRDGKPANPPVTAPPAAIPAGTTVYGVLFFSDQMPGLVFRPSCYLASSGQVYLAEGAITSYAGTVQSVQAEWIPAGELFTRWATTP